VEPLGELSIRHQPPGELIDQHHAPILDNVVGVLLVVMPGAQRQLQMMEILNILWVVEVFNAELLLGARDAGVVHVDLLALLVQLEVLINLEFGGESGELLV